VRRKFRAVAASRQVLAWSGLDRQVSMPLNVASLILLVKLNNV